MGKKHRCWVGGCNNDQRYPDLVVKRSHVSELIWHRWPKGEPYQSFWENAYRKGTKISSQVRAWLYVRTTSWMEKGQLKIQCQSCSWLNRSNIPFPLESDRSTAESASIIADKAIYHQMMFRKMTPKLQRIVFIPDLNLGPWLAMSIQMGPWLAVSIQMQNYAIKVTVNLFIWHSPMAFGSVGESSMWQYISIIHCIDWLTHQSKLSVVQDYI